jgi:hypothetical protein
MHDDDILQRDMFTAGSLLDGFTGAVHEGLRQEGRDGQSVDIALSPATAVAAPLLAQLPGSDKAFDRHEANVMPGVSILIAGVAKTDHQDHRPGISAAALGEQWQPHALINGDRFRGDTPFDWKT